MYNGPCDVSRIVNRPYGIKFALGISRNGNTNTGKLIFQPIFLKFIKFCICVLLGHALACFGMLKEGRKEGRTEGRKEGRTDGRAEGRAGGRKEGRKGGRNPNLWNECPLLYNIVFRGFVLICIYRKAVIHLFWINQPTSSAVITLTRVLKCLTPGTYFSRIPSHIMLYNAI